MLTSQKNPPNLFSHSPPETMLSAKTQIPRQGERICRRKRLFRQISALLEKGNLWVGGPPGAGKTVLTADFSIRTSISVAWYEIDLLDADLVTFFSGFPGAFHLFNLSSSTISSLPKLLPEDMLALPVFARKFFRSFFQCLPDEWLLVFDNVQEIPQDSPLLELMVICLQELPIKCKAIFLSRLSPPPAFAKMKTSGSLQVLAAEDLRFTSHEIGEVMALHGIVDEENGCVKYLKQTTNGWAAGLTLLLKEQNKEICAQGIGDKLNNQELFDYFTGVIFSKLSHKNKYLLVQAALLPDIRPDILDLLQDNSSSRKYFMELSRNNFFTYALDRKGDLFQFHPLFKEFLRNVADNILPASELSSFQKKATEILVSEGRTEDAIELLNRAGKWPESVVLIKKTGATMVEQGRFKTLLRWQQNLPQNVVNKDPWLLFFFGNAATAFNPLEAIDIFKKSFDLFQAEENTTGALLACSSLTNSIINHLCDLSALDPWLDFLEQQLDPHTFPNDGCFENISISNAIFRALVLRRPSHPDIEAWLLLVVKQGGMHPALITHYLWTGRFTEARAALDRIYVHQNKIGSKLQLSAIKAMEVQYYLIIGEPENCCRVIDESLQMISETGIRVWEIHFLILGAGCCINSNKPEKAESYLLAVEKNIDKSRLLERSYYHVVKTLESLLADDLSAADRHQQSALEMAITIGMPSYEMWCRYGAALVSVFKNNKATALSNFERVFELAASPGNPWFTCQAYLGLAYMYLRKGNRQTAVRYLQEGFHLARHHNYLNFFFFLPKMMGTLAITALEENIEADFVCRFIRCRQLIPIRPPLHLENWPWPLKIYTMGRFSIVRNGEKLTPSSASKSKPVMLLQALIALGGRQVSKIQLREIFWPDSEGDDQAAALKITLHRLRQLLGLPNVIKQSAGHISLNPDLCWVDCWQFGRLANEAVDMGKTSPEKMPAIRKALAAYLGTFLSSYKDESWTLNYRQQLEKTHEHLVEHAGLYGE